MEEVWQTFGDDTYVPKEKDMGTPEDWQEAERDPAVFEELRRAFGLPSKDQPPEPGQRSDPGSPEPEQRNNVPIVAIQPVSMEPVHEYPERHVHPVTYVHPEQVVMPEAHSEVQRQPEAGTSTRKIIPPQSEEKSSEWKNNPPKSEEKASKPEAGTSTPGSRNPKGRKFNAAGGRIHTEAQIDQILDEYLGSGQLPSYVSERQRYDYRHHIRLPERRLFLDKQQTAAGNQASGPHPATSPKDTIIQFPGTGTHHP